MNKEINLDEDNVLFNWMKKNYGERCLEFEKGCACCEAWIFYDKLIQREDSNGKKTN